MPLTAKGAEIKKNMQEEYGTKKGESVFYASKNAGKITGVDAVDPTASAASQPSSEASEEPSMATELPTADQFRKSFRDAVSGGMPISASLGLSTTPKSLDPGMVWTGGKKVQNWQAKDSFCKLVKDGLKKGLSLDKIIRDALPGEGTVGGFGWQGAKPDKAFYRVTAEDRRKNFKDNFRRNYNKDGCARDAIRKSVDAALSESNGSGAESWVGGKKNSTGYQINDKGRKR